MIRILQVVNCMDRAGLETMLMNYYRNIDRTKVQFDFLTHRPYRGTYDDEIESMGGKIYYAPRLYPQNYYPYFKYMKQFFKSHPEYKIIHSHIDTMTAFPLLCAKRSSVPVRIAHSHSSKLDKDMKLPIKYIAKLVVPNVANNYFACGEVAGKFLYRNRSFRIIRNAIDLEKYKYNETIRKDVRNKLNIKDDFTIGHVGRYCYIKNQSFVIDVFNEIIKVKPNSKLLLIGKGPDEKMLKEKVNKLGLQNKVLFLIDRNDVHELYQAMDVFIMPSLFEGLPLVGVEAQANGLPCIISDKVSNEIVLTDNIQLMKLADTAVNWSNKILNLDIHRSLENYQLIVDKGYDIKCEAKDLMNMYISLSENKC